MVIVGMLRVSAFVDWLLLCIVCLFEVFVLVYLGAGCLFEWCLSVAGFVDVCVVYVSVGLFVGL